MNRNLIIFCLIILLFLFSRLFDLLQNPPSLYWDEASIAYNAYSVSLDGKDEWGDFFPLHFRAFGEFKLPVYIYTVAFFEKIIGLNEFAVRLPAVIFSLGSVILIYFIAKKIFNNSTLGLLSAFFMTVSPWFYIFSKTGYEVTAGLMFFLLGILCFLYSKKETYVYAGLVSLFLSAYSYNSFRILVPLTVIFWFFAVLKTSSSLIKKGRIGIITFFSLGLSILPIWRLFRDNPGINRFETVSIFSTSSNFFELVQNLIANFLSHFSPNFLLIYGDTNLRSQIGAGQLYLLEAVLIFLGVIFILRYNRPAILLLVFLIFSIIPAAITKESPHALRSLTAAAVLSMLSAAGVMLVGKYAKSGAVSVIIIFMSLMMFLNYLWLFINNFPGKSSASWQYGYKEVFLNYKEKFNNYDQIYISDNLGQPYIFALYYLKYPPDEFRRTVSYNPPNKWGKSLVASFSKFSFFDHLPENIKPNSLLFIEPGISVNLRKIAEVRNLDNSLQFNVYEN